MNGDIFSILFGFIGSAFGYILWGAYCLINNYGVAIILFTIIIKLLLFPLSVKQQKAQAGNFKLNAKQKELSVKYAKNREKYNEEMMKLREKEGVGMSGGCLPTLLPMILLFGVYYAVINPLTNTLHIAADSVNKAIADLVTLPGIGSTFTTSYSQIDIIRLMQSANGKSYLANYFSADQMDKITSYSNGYNFCGLNLLDKPSDALWPLILIPIFCFITSMLSSWIMMKMQGNAMEGQPGCMKYAMFFIPLISVFFSYYVPAAVGFYWIISTILGFVNSLVLNKLYSPSILIATEEARHIELLRLNEKKVKYDYQPRFDEAIVPEIKSSTKKNKKK